MKLQIASRLAVYAVLELARNPDQQISAAEIGRTYGISTHHLAKVMHTLGRAGLVRRQMAALAQSGRFDVVGGAEALAGDFAAAAAGEADVADCIRRVRTETGYVLEPHTACGVLAAERTSPGETVPEIVLATAHPAKFAEAMAEITGAAVALPARLAHLLRDAERATSLANDLSQVERHIEAHARVMQKETQ